MHSHNLPTLFSFLLSGMDGEASREVGACLYPVRRQTMDYEVIHRQGCLESEGILYLMRA